MDEKYKIERIDHKNKYLKNEIIEVYDHIRAGHIIDPASSFRFDFNLNAEQFSIILDSADALRVATYEQRVAGWSDAYIYEDSMSPDPLAEVECYVLPEHRSRGLATRLLQEVVDECLTKLEIKKVTAITNPKNQSIRKVLSQVATELNLRQNEIHSNHPTLEKRDTSNRVIINLSSTEN